MRPPVKPILFGPFLVTPQVFHISVHSFALVNLKPLLPGHVLVSPLRRVSRFQDLSSEEVTDLFLTVQRVGRMVERVFHATALNIAIQDGVDAGQSVPHVHAHIIPRKAADLDDRGGIDSIYKMMDGDEGDVGGHLSQRRRGRGLPTVDSDARMPRSDEEMENEARWLAEEMDLDNSPTGI